MRDKDVYLPLNEANTDRIRTVLSLPYGNSQRVGLHTAHIHRLLQIGGISHLRIEADRDIIHSSLGVSANGLATFEARSITFQDDIRYELDPAGINTNKMARWPRLKVIYSPDMMEAIVDREYGGVREPSAWAAYLSQSLRRAIVLAGVKNLLSLPEGFDRWYTLLLYSDEVFFTLAGKNPIDLGTFAIPFLLFCLQTRYYGKESEGKGRRVSLFYGIEPDRALVLSLLSILKPLAKEMPLSSR